MNKTLHYINGKWLSDPTISVFDLSVLRGFGIFDYLRTYNQKPFRLDDHIDRLFNSAKEFDMVVPKTREQIKKIVLEGISKNSLPEYSVRILLTGGVSSNGIAKEGNSSFAILFAEIIDFPKSSYTKGVSVITRQFERAYPTVKSTNYLTAINVLSEAAKRKATEVVYLDWLGRILEGTTSNFFAVMGGKLVTPRENIMYGITRKVVLELAKKMKVPVVETEVLYSQISLFDEAFLTSSNKEVMPVVTIDRQTVGNGKVGPVTKKIIKEYDILVS